MKAQASAARDLLFGALDSGRQPYSVDHRHVLALPEPDGDPKLDRIDQILPGLLMVDPLRHAPGQNRGNRYYASDLRIFPVVGGLQDLADILVQTYVSHRVPHTGALPFRLRGYCHGSR